MLRTQGNSDDGDDDVGLFTDRHALRIIYRGASSPDRGVPSVGDADGCLKKPRSVIPGAPGDEAASMALTLN